MVDANGSRCDAVRRPATPRGSARWLLRACICGALWPAQAIADVPEAYVTRLQDLRFGRMVVFGSGTRTVSPAGSVTSSSTIMSASNDFPGPAQFAVGYDRGNNGVKSLDVVMQITFGAVPPVSQGGVSGTVTGLASDLAGAETITAGQTVTVTIRRCTTRQCGVMFNIGGQIELTRLWGGAELSTPIPVSVTVVSVS